MTNLKVTPEGVGAEENTEEEDSQYDNYIKNGKAKVKRKRADDFGENEVIRESKLRESLKCTPTDASRGNSEEDRVVHTSFDLSPYAVNLLGIIKRNGKTKRGDLRVLSKPKVVLDVTSSTIDSFYNYMRDRYITISNINQLAAEINASSGKVTIFQPVLKVDIDNEEEYVHIDALILSSTLTKIKMLSEEFGTSTSWIVEYLIYMYIVESDNSCYDDFRGHCKERISTFLFLLDKFISESTLTNKEDENAIVRIAYKMLASKSTEQTRTNNAFAGYVSGSIELDVGSSYNINAKFILKEKTGKRSYDESHSKGIFKKKCGRKLSD